jgi:succinate dehydrogenase / fumarate reductase cytochrome b subunit
MGTWFGLLVLFGYTWALLHHMLGGLRHLLWDLRIGIDKESATRLAWATVIASVALTILIWIVVFAVR